MSNMNKENSIRLIRDNFKQEYKLDVTEMIVGSYVSTYTTDYVHYLENLILDKWVSVDESLPTEYIKVICYHKPSGNYFVSWIVRDCNDSSLKWSGGDRPTHWSYINKPILQDENKRLDS